MRFMSAYCFYQIERGNKRVISLLVIRPFSTTCNLDCPTRVNMTDIILHSANICKWSPTIIESYAISTNSQTCAAMSFVKVDNFTS